MICPERRPARVFVTLAAVALAADVLSCRRDPAFRSSSVSALAPTRPSRVDPPVPTSVLTPSERTAVEEFLRAHPDLRPAADADCQAPRDADGDLRRLYGVYHPYFVRGDVNDDGVLDFVIAFVHRDTGSGTPWFSVAVFTGRSADKGFNAGTFLERDIALVHGDLSIDRDAILITPDLSDDEAVRRYRWDPLRRFYVVVRDDEEDVETPVLSQT